MTTALPQAGPSVAADARGRNAFHRLKVASVDPLTEDSAAVTFAVPDELQPVFDFRAGQSLTLRRDIGGGEERRSYSICSPAGSPPRIGVREIPDGVFSRWLVHEVRPGDVVEVQAPTGRLQADASVAHRHLCVAAGSGITPLLSIVATVLTEPGSQVTLLYGNRTTGSVMFAEELADLKNRYGARLELVHVLSREPRDVELFSGRLDGDRLRRLLATLVPVHALDHVWLCGPFAMVTEARAVLAELGVPREAVHVELFHVDEPPPELVREDAVVEGDSSEVTVVLDGRTTVTGMPRSGSILDGAAASRSDVPFACKGGVCGTCRARVVAGAVDMRRNYALDDDEVERGFVLTCQTRPVSESVTVDFDA